MYEEMNTTAMIICIGILAGVLLFAYSCLPVIWHFQHRKKMRKYISQVRKAFDGVLLNERERIMLQAYLDAMEYIGLRDEVMADFKKSEEEKLQHVLDELGAIRNDAGTKASI